MPNLDFYAADEDFRLVLDFVFEQPGWRLVEASSREDMPLRTFTSTAAVLEAFDVAVWDAVFYLHAADARGSIHERWVADARARPSGHGWTVVEGWGLIQLQLKAPRAETLRPSHTNHNSERRARAHELAYEQRLGSVDAWDWAAVARASRRLNNHVRRLAVGRHGSRPVLPAAARRLADGASISEN